METCFLRWTAGGRPKTSSKGKTSTLPNTEHIPMRNWILLKELSEIGSWPWLQQRRWQQPWENREWQTSKRIFIRKSKDRIQTNTYILTFNQLHIPKKWILAIISKELNNMSQHPWGASNAKNMATTGKLADDERHEPSTLKRTETTWKKIA